MEAPNNIVSKIAEQLSRKEVCANCKYWNDKGAGPNSGYCCKNSPKPELVKLEKNTDFRRFVNWPITTQYQWCGDFKKKNSSE